jgi:phosphopantothenate synthetase
MNIIDNFPKSIKKFVRYINHEAEKEQLEEIKKIIDQCNQETISKS